MTSVSSLQLQLEPGAANSVTVVQVMSKHGNGLALIVNQEVIFQVDSPRSTADAAAVKQAKNLERSGVKLAAAIGCPLGRKVFRSASPWTWDNIATLLSLRAPEAPESAIQRLYLHPFSLLTNEDIELLAEIADDYRKSGQRVDRAMGGFMIRLHSDPHLNVWAELFRKRGEQNYTVCELITKVSTLGYQWLAIIPE